VSAPRFGFFFWPWSPEYTARMAGLAERDGWDLVGIADTPGNAMDLWVALTLAATRTGRVGLAACVTNLATRHPAITAGAAADGAFVNYGLQPEHVAHAAALLDDGAAQTGRAATDVETWWIACLDCAPTREAAHASLGNILGFVAAYILGPAPAARGVPADLVAAVHELRATYTTRHAEMDAGLVRRLGLFDYLRRRLAIAGTPDDCVEQAGAALTAGATRLMFTVSLASDPVRTVELFGAEVLPVLRRRYVRSGS